MYFVDVEHQENYEWLMNLYSLERGEDLEYEANIYIAAYPTIFGCFRKNKIDVNQGGPLANLIYDEDNRHDTGGLTGSTWQMIYLGMSLYNSYKVSLDEVFGSVADKKLVDVCIEAIRIRARKYW